MTFNLHASFVNPQRTVTAAPFELTEEGWGEFEIVVAVSNIGTVTDGYDKQVTPAIMALIVSLVLHAINCHSLMQAVNQHTQ